jgi:murein DD-endopeptidase MepM/ murein hydrolase activator NlpD
MKQLMVWLTLLLMILGSGEPAAAAKGGWAHPAPNARTSTCYSSAHRGVDLYRSHRSPVRAARSGKVVYAGWNDGYGRLVVIWHVGLNYTAYGHLDSISVRNQQRVKTSQAIGRQGQSGDATGSHLHFEVWRGGWYKKVNPASFMRRRSVRLGGCG